MLFVCLWYVCMFVCFFVSVFLTSSKRTGLTKTIVPSCFLKIYPIKSIYLPRLVLKGEEINHNFPGTTIQKKKKKKKKIVNKKNLLFNHQPTSFLSHSHTLSPLSFSPSCLSTSQGIWYKSSRVGIGTFKFLFSSGNSPRISSLFFKYSIICMVVVVVGRLENMVGWVVIFFLLFWSLSCLLSFSFLFHTF